MGFGLGLERSLRKIPGGGSDFATLEGLKKRNCFIQ